MLISLFSVVVVTWESVSTPPWNLPPLRRILTQGLCLDWATGLPDNLKLAISLDFTNEYRLVQVVISCIHLHCEAAGRLEGLAAHCGNNLVHIGGAGLLDGLLPHVDPDIGGLHRIVGQGLAGAGEIFLPGINGPFFLPLIIGRVLERHEVVPRSEMPHQWFGIHTTQLLFTHRERSEEHTSE